MKNTNLNKKIIQQVQRKIKQKFLQNYKYAFLNNHIEDYTVFINTIPKSGTHLIYNMLKPIEGLRWFDEFIVSKPSRPYRQVSDRLIFYKIEKLINKEVARAHLEFKIEYLQYLNEKKAIIFFLIRDPRDILISEINYLSNINIFHSLYPYFHKEKSLEKRIIMSLEGFQDNKIILDPFSDRINSFLGWMDNKNNVTTLKYENFVSQNKQIDMICNAFSEKNTIINETTRKKILDFANPKFSHTFTSLSKKKLAR